MHYPELTSAAKLDPATASAVAALEDDPFYRAIAVEYRGDDIRRRHALGQYFDYSIREGERHGRTVHLEDPALGVAVWLLPHAPEARSRESTAKRIFLERALGIEGCENYYRIVEFMHERTARLIGQDAWYLSIVAVNPTAQGRGLGRKLLQPTIAEADRVSAVCYLETFTPRNISFYERMRFSVVGRITEPTTRSEYAVMVRFPHD